MLKEILEARKKAEREFWEAHRAALKTIKEVYSK